MLPYERLVADDIEVIKKYNNELHPKQKRYPGKTRWQVLQENLNPNSPAINKPLVYRYIGYKTQTSINRSQWATVRGGKYQIPSPSILEKLTPGNLSVDAYWLPDAEGGIAEVYLYQNDV